MGVLRGWRRAGGDHYRPGSGRDERDARAVERRTGLRPLAHISAQIDPVDRGDDPIQEIESDTFDNVVKANLAVERPEQLRDRVERGIKLATSIPHGPVRRGIPSGFLERPIDSPCTIVELERVICDNDQAYEPALDLLENAERPAIYVGEAARRSIDGPTAVRELAEVLDAPVVVSFTGKGTFPEDDCQFQGVTGSHLPADAREVVAVADVVLALGTDFDGVRTHGWGLPMGEALVHVNVDPDEIGRSCAADVGIIEAVGEAGATLLSRLRESGGVGGGWDGKAVAGRARALYEEHLRREGFLEDTSPAMTPSLLVALRQAIPREAIATTDIGGFRL